jgi:aryl carrier-like protein
MAKKKETAATPQLSDAKRALLERWKTGGVPKKKEEGIPRRPDPASAPLSFAQQRLWFLDQLHPGDTAYNDPALLRLTGRLDLDALRGAFARVVERHEILRTAFETRDGKARQILPGRVELPFPVVDLGGLEEERRGHAARRAAASAAWRSFDLGRAPLLRCLLLRRGPEHHELLVVFHHIVSDVWSRGILIGEVGRLYEALGSGRPAPLPAPAIQYGDYAHWQRKGMPEVLERQLGWWRERLGTPPEPLEMPTDHPRSLSEGRQGERARFRLPESLRGALGPFCREHNVTLFMVLLTAFHALLLRYTGKRDLVIGTPVANRDRGELEGLIGFFVNTLALRIDGDTATFGELLGRVREVALGAFAHRDVPFELLVEKLAPQRELGDSSFFQVVFVLQNAPVSRIDLPDLRIETLELEIAAAKFDLSLNFEESAEGISGFFEYDAALFDRTTVVRMVGHYQRLLRGLVEDPGQHPAEIVMESRGERHQLVVEWNAPHPHGEVLERLAGAAAVEEILRGIWCQVLDVPEVGAQESFLDLGGDSLRGLAVVDRARRRGLALDRRMLFEMPTLAELARGIVLTGGDAGSGTEKTL